jgi:two-component system response regulator DevR
MQCLKLLIVDDHKDARTSLVDRLSNESNIVVKGLPASAPEALNDAMTENPDVVLLDVKTYLGDGIQLCREMVTNYPKVKVMVLTSCASSEELDELQKTGIAGYLFKDLDLASLLGAIWQGR